MAANSLAGLGDALGRFDAVACNFALLDEDLAPLLQAVRGLLAPGGRLVVQTVHPWGACGEEPYRDGWRLETFEGFGAQVFPAARVTLSSDELSLMLVDKNGGAPVKLLQA